LQIRCKSLYFVSDLITYFWGQIHCLLLFLAIWRFLIRTQTLHANFEYLEANWMGQGSFSSVPQHAGWDYLTQGNRRPDEQVIKRFTCF
jgi:hypothetical protein